MQPPLCAVIKNNDIKKSASRSRFFDEQTSPLNAYTVSIYHTGVTKNFDSRILGSLLANLKTIYRETLAEKAEAEITAHEQKTDFAFSTLEEISLFLKNIQCFEKTIHIPPQSHEIPMGSLSPEDQKIQNERLQKGILLHLIGTIYNTIFLETSQLYPSKLSPPR